MWPGFGECGPNSGYDSRLSTQTWAVLQNFWLPYSSLSANKFLSYMYLHVLDAQLHLNVDWNHRCDDSVFTYINFKSILFVGVE